MFHPTRTTTQGGMHLNFNINLREKFLSCLTLIKKYLRTIVLNQFPFRYFALPRTTVYKFRFKLNRNDEQQPKYCNRAPHTTQPSSSFYTIRRRRLAFGYRFSPLNKSLNINEGMKGLSHAHTHMHTGSQDVLPLLVCCCCRMFYKFNKFWQSAKQKEEEGKKKQ